MPKRPERFTSLKPDEEEPTFRFTPSGCNALDCLTRGSMPTQAIVMAASHFLSTHSLDNDKHDDIVGVAELEEVPEVDILAPESLN